MLWPLKLQVFIKTPSINNRQTCERPEFHIKPKPTKSRGHRAKQKLERG